MRFSTSSKLFALLVTMALLLSGVYLFAQETTGGLQGTVKDATGAVVAGAHIVVTAPTLVGSKSLDADSSGYYRFANLPPGTYTITVTVKNFKTVKREGVTIEVGHLPTLDLTLEVGTASEVVEVTGAAPIIDVTTVTTQTNVTQDIVQDVPHGRSFQSVIQFAPSARNEPLMGSTAANGSGGMVPGSATNGSAFGYSVGGASDAENSYLVEGQQTANLIGGFSHTNVPFDFIQEVQVKSTGQEAQYGGALGGVVNVVMRKGTNSYHGSAFAQYETFGMDGSPNAYSRYDPAQSLTPPGGTFADGTPNTANAYFDPAYQNYQPIRRKGFDVMPGFTFGGPILKDRVFAFVGFNPELYGQTRTVDMSSQGLGKVPFSRNIQTYYTTARVDAEVTQKVRVFASWLYQYQRVHGVSLPADDSTTGLVNAAGSTDPSVYGHNLGYKAPNVTFNVGADISITPRLVSTTRLGYYFENYVDAGYPTSGTLFQWQTDGTTSTDNQGNPLPPSLQELTGVWNAAHSGSYTRRDANKALQFDQDVAFFKSGWGGTHNFKFGYQLNHLRNDILQTYNMPYVQLFPGQGGFYSPGSQTGIDNCQAVFNAGGFADFDSGGNLTDCAGLYGTAIISDFGTGGNVSSYNHGLFAQDAWTMGHGITINAGIRFDKEYLPASSTAGLNYKPINYSWTDKVAPRIGAAWDVFRDGRMKVFGSYGKFFDIMKLNVAISSFGGQYWNDCAYTLDTADLSTIVPAFNSGNRYCPSAFDAQGQPDNSAQANWAGSAPAGMTFLENLNYRTFPTTCATCSLTSTGVTPGLKPYEQHESVFGMDYQVHKNLALEVRWDRRRLDHVIEDSSLYAGGETFVIGNPGQGTESTYSSFYNFLYPTTQGFAPLDCSANPCPPDKLIPASRSYDAVEFRLTKGQSKHWSGMFSYTYSKLRGNYTGLTSSDASDGQLGGRSSPNNSRAFDEPYFQWNSLGGSSSGLLPTDRPSTFKGYAYYELGWLKKLTTNFGIFQYLYSGSPETSYLDVGAGNGGWAVQAWDRSKWVDVSQDPTTGFITIGAPHTQRTPWFTQTDFSIQQSYKIAESKQLSFIVNFTNLLNQRAVTAVNEDITSLAVTNQYIALNNPGSGVCAFSTQCRIVDGTTFYAAAEQAYNVQDQMNNFKSNVGRSAALNSNYGHPQYYQLSRNIRLGVKFTF